MKRGDMSVKEIESMKKSGENLEEEVSLVKH